MLPGKAVGRPVVIAQIAVAFLLIAKIYLAAVAPPIGDEAYYWMWGQKLAWSYFDHPPLHAWLLRVMSMLFGWNLFSLRALTWLTLGGTLWIMWQWAKRLMPEDPQAWFWPSAALYLASPLFFWTSGVSFHDHLLTLLCIASGYAFLLFAERWESDGKGFHLLYLGAALLGLATLTKYNGALLGIGIAIFFVVHKPLRPLWRSPHLYLAALLSVAIQAPVFMWNFSEGMASYKFHLSERWGGTPVDITPGKALSYLALTVVTFSPFLLPALLGIIRKPLGQPFADRARTLALAVLASSLALMGFLSFFVDVFFYWNIVGFVLLMPLLAGWMRFRITHYLHLLYGAVFVLGYISYTTIDPRNDWTIASTFGWPGVAERIDALRVDRNIGFIAASRYTTAAQLGFAMDDPDVVTIAERHDQYDYWFVPADHEGQNALVVADPVYGPGYIATFFDRFEALETVPYGPYGQVIYSPTIYLGTGFHATPKP